ncbi:MAG TPA: TonB-dependent receptor, partial [Gammaproteobacteria bacterium]|nr:TonB-dependent receptor [Gammaproteobacteria bacterium]
MKNFFKNNYLSTYILFIFYILITSSSFAKEPTIIPDSKLKSKKTTQLSARTDISTTQFSKTDIEKSPVVNLSQFLKQEQSVVRLTNTSGDASQIAVSLRGFGDNAAANSLILVDGFPLINPSLLTPNFNSIPLSDIEKLEIFQGSEGTLWGDQAVGGVVNITTKHPKKLNVDAILSLGSYRSYYDNIFIENKTDNGFFIKLFGLLGKTDNYREHNLHKANNLALQLGMDYSRGVISFNMQSYSDKIYFPGGLTETQFHHNPRQATEWNNHSQYRTNVFQLLNKHELNNTWLLETRMDHHQTRGDGLVNVDFNREDSLTNFHSRLIGNVNHHKMTFGYYGQLSHYQLVNINVNDKASATQNDMYAQDIFSLNQKINLTLGARKAWQLNQIDAIPNETLHSLNQVFVTEQGLSFQPFENLSFFIRRDGNFRFPKANEETWLPDNVTSLQVQTGTSYEMGGKWQTPLLISQLSLYRLDLKNEIAYNPLQTDTQPFGAYNNLDPTRRYGISIAEQYSITTKAKLNAQMNYVNARFSSGEFSGNFIPAVPAVNGNIGLNYQWTDQWMTQYFLLYTGNRYASNDVQNEGKKLPGFWLHDLALQYLMKPCIFNFEIHNIFNQNYASYAYYNTLTQQNTYYPGAGRSFLLT